MATKRRKLTEVEEVERMLKDHGFHEVTKEEKKELWYKKLMDYVNSPERKQHLHPTSMVRESPRPYRPKRKRASTNR
jgi:hypothetical protein